MRPITLSSIAALLVGVSSPLAAAPVTFSYAGACIQNCEEADVSLGDPATARVTVDDAGFNPFGAFGLESLVDFEVTFADQTFTRSNTPFMSFTGFWDARPGTATIFLEGSRSDSFPGLDATFDLFGYTTFASGTFSPRGACEFDPFVGTCSVSFNGAGLYELDATPIPLPPAGWLLVGGLGLLGAFSAGARRRRRS